jgi:GH24 family phage-related lysozyme (muramidase)
VGENEGSTKLSAYQCGCGAWVTPGMGHSCLSPYLPPDPRNNRLAPQFEFVPPRTIEQRLSDIEAKLDRLFNRLTGEDA